MDKVEVLRRYRDCIDVWCSLVEEEKRLRSLAEGVTASLSGLPGGTGDGPGKVGIVLEGMERILNEITEEQCRIEDLRKEALQVIRSIEDSRERTVLRFYLINHFGWQEISCRTGYDERYVRRLYHRAVQNLQSAASGI